TARPHRATAPGVPAERGDARPPRLTARPGPPILRHNVNRSREVVSVRIIDADTHVDETEDTWEYMEPGEQHLKPTTGFPPNPDPTRPASRYWLIDGHRQPRFIRNDTGTHTTVQTRELMDVEARLRDMD